MKLKNFLFLLVILKSIPTYACQKDTIKLFYDINQKELSNPNKAKLDSLGKWITDTTTVQILGFADYLGNKDYNYTLSKTRADIVKSYLSQLNSRNSLMIANGKGQVNPAIKNPSILGDPLNRRVDIIVPVKNNPSKASSTLKKKDDSVYAKIDNLSKLDVGGSVNFTELTFLRGRHFLNEDAKPYLEALTTYLKQHENLKIEIRGHICCDYAYSDGYDLDTRHYSLSLNRAKYIYDYLVSQGIKAERMRYKGLGSSEPKVYPEQTADDEKQNRRVQIVLLAK